MLPGKLCIGILEEDNPLKSYFRLKPLLVEIEGKYVHFEGGADYPEEGSIRIVPDKNESSHFKARMRRMGRYCVLDLRDHAGESDKIRPNKNYRGDETEKNAHIVYSDVVREPAENMIFEFAPDGVQEGDWSGEAPGTPRLVASDGLSVWNYIPGEEEAAAHIAPGEGVLEEDQIQRFELPGFGEQLLRFAIRLPGTMESVILAPQPKPEKPAPAPIPAAEAPKPAPQPEPPKPAPEKPWISHDLPPVAPPRGHMNPLQQALAAQSGLNPRRNRSLQEIIEEKWRHSRMDQLGQPIPGKAMGHPVENPLEKALDALRNAWRIPEIHDRLVCAICEMEDFSAALNCQRQDANQQKLRRELEDLEAERLKSLDALEKLRREKKNLRETFKQEIRQEEAAAFRDAVDRTRAAQAELKKQQIAVEEAKKATAVAKDAFAALSDGRFEQKLMDFALTSRAAELLRKPEQVEIIPEIVSDETPTREEWIGRMCRAAQMEGLALDELHAADLLVCAALSDSLILSGPASADKTAMGRALARALGAVDSGRYFETADGELPEGIRRDSALPCAALLRGANDTPGPLDQGLCGAAENLIVLSQASDGGFPLSAEALERGFLLRLEGENAHTPWRKPAYKLESFSPVSMNALKQAFLVEADLPPALERRLQKLRDGLALHGVRISRHSLDCMWQYCAAMLSLNRISPAETLDLAFAQKALPCILAEAPVECLMEMKELLAGMPHSLALLDTPLPLPI